MPDLDWEDEDVPEGVDPKTAPVIITVCKPARKPTKAANLPRQGLIARPAA